MYIAQRDDGRFPSFLHSFIHIFIFPLPDTNGSKRQGRIISKTQQGEQDSYPAAIGLDLSGFPLPGDTSFCLLFLPQLPEHIVPLTELHWRPHTSQCFMSLCGSTFPWYGFSPWTIGSFHLSLEHFSVLWDPVCGRLDNYSAISTASHSISIGATYALFIYLYECSVDFMPQEGIPL